MRWWIYMEPGESFFADCMFAGSGGRHVPRGLQQPERVGSGVGQEGGSGAGKEAREGESMKTAVTRDLCFYSS